MLARALAALALVILVGYGAIEAWPLVSGPHISIDSPLDHSVATEGTITITGRALRTETLWLNGGPLLIDQKGAFSTSLLLPSGGAILSLTATDRFGHEITERRAVFIP
ncbi:MAG: hypothetical protein AB199_00050 [Parcubacteria bacterium C7867-004]|nr:MAG: hypothetical protein AB199_00050 [Parcubacteria bacterium C7867-004]